MICWLIEKYDNSVERESLYKEVLRQNLRGLYVTAAEIISPNFIKKFRKDETVIFQGSIELAGKIKGILNESGCKVLVYCDLPRYQWIYYYDKFRNLLLNKDFAVSTPEILKKHKFVYFFEYGKDAKIFVRPNRGDKPFTGQLVDLQDFEKFSETARDEFIIISSPKEIIGEWRFICLGHEFLGHKLAEIIASTTYMYQGQRTLIPSAPNGALDLCYEVLDRKFFPDEVFCVDICQTKDGKFHLLELNAFSTAGLYAADEEAIVKKVSEIAGKEPKRHKVMGESFLKTTK